MFTTMHSSTCANPHRSHDLASHIGLWGFLHAIYLCNSLHGRGSGERCACRSNLSHSALRSLDLKHKPLVCPLLLRSKASAYMLPMPLWPVPPPPPPRAVAGKTEDELCHQITLEKVAFLFLLVSPFSHVPRRPAAALLTATTPNIDDNFIYLYTGDCSKIKGCFSSGTQTR